jgi:RND family efflux transporter MFP subunit
MLSKTKIADFFTGMRNAPPRGDHRKGRWLILTVILLAVVGGGIYLRGIFQPAQTVAIASELKTAVARQGDLVIYASGSGALIAQSGTSFGFNTSGQVTKLNVKVGDVVKAGQALAELENTSATLNYQKAQRALNELTSPAAIAIAKQAVATAEYNVFTTREDLQYLVSPAVQIWQERLANDEKALAEAQAEATANPSAEANQKMQEAQDVVTLDQFYLAQAQENYYTYLKDNFSETEANQRTGRTRIVYYKDEATGKSYANIHAPTETWIAVAQATYELSKATLEEAKTYLAAVSGETIPEGAASASLTMLENAKSNVQAAQMELENTQLTAPISGTVMSLDFKVGDFVGGNSAIMTISDLFQPSLEIFLNESDWGNIQVGYETEVTFDILPDSAFTGKVVRVDPGLYTGNNTPVVRAIVKLDAVGDAFNLPLGSTASVAVIGGRAQNAVLIPVEALHKAGDQYAVFVMTNGELRLRIVKIGIQNSLYAEVISGLQAGDVVSTGITETK